MADKILKLICTISTFIEPSLINEYNLLGFICILLTPLVAIKEILLYYGLN